MPPVQAHAVPLSGFVFPKVFEMLREAPESVFRVMDVAPMAPTPVKVIVDPLVVLVIIESPLTLSFFVFIYSLRWSILFLLIPYAVLSKFKSTRLFFAIFVLLISKSKVILPKMSSYKELVKKKKGGNLLPLLIIKCGFTLLGYM